MSNLFPFIFLLFLEISASTIAPSNEKAARINQLEIDRECGFATYLAIDNYKKQYFYSAPESFEAFFASNSYYLECTKEEKFISIYIGEIGDDHLGGGVIFSFRRDDFSLSEILPQR